jgi:hypothetical protein
VKEYLDDVVQNFAKLGEEEVGEKDCSESGYVVRANRRKYAKPYLDRIDRVESEEKDNDQDANLRLDVGQLGLKKGKREEMGENEGMNELVKVRGRQIKKKQISA